MGEERFTFGAFEFDAARGVLTQAGVPVDIGQRGVALLATLLKADNQVVGKSALMDAAWPGLAVEESNLSVQVATLRKRLGDEWITTVPRVGYRFAGAVAPVGPQPAPDRPAIAVLPFANASGDAAHDYLAHGLSEDISTALGRFRWFVVKARHAGLAVEYRSLGVRYLLGGSIRRSGDHVRVTAELSDAVQGTQIWAERYDLDHADVFAVQDEIAARVAGAIEPELLRSEAALAVSRNPANPTALDLVRRGAWSFHQVTRATHHEARDLFRQACRLDPSLPEAQIWRARVSAGIIAYGWSDDIAADREEGLAAGLRAVRLDEKNPYAHYGVAIVSLYADETAQAVRAAERAVELNASFAIGHLVLGLAQLFSGRAAEAAGPLERGLRLSPFDPQNFVWFNLLALARLFAGEAEAALDAARRSLQVRPDWRPAVEAVACAQVELGQRREAEQSARRLNQLARPPDDVLGPLRASRPDWAERIKTLLAEAGA